MDEIDLTILGALRKDGRMSFRELGDMVNLSPNATADRVRRLIANRTIRSITANIDLAALGRSIEAQIDVKLDHKVSAAAFEKALVGIPQIQSACLMTGSFDYAVRVACKNQEDLVSVIEYLRIKAGARETYSRVIQRQLNFT